MLKRDKRETALEKLVADNTEVPGTFWATDTPLELTHCCCALIRMYENIELKVGNN